MRKNYLQPVNLIAIAVLLCSFMFSCTSTKKIKYFQDIPDSGQNKEIAKATYSEPKIQVGDVLSIVIQTVDPTATVAVNAGNVGNSASAATAALSTSNMALPLGMPGTNAASSSLGYLVDANGEVNIPVVGVVKVAGLTTPEATTVVQKAADQYYKMPYVVVRFSNFKINIAGEVARPGTYIMPSEKITILDAISMAGDLTIFGKRENVLLIRENPDGTKTTYRFNLKKSDFMTSPYYYLKQNDYVYVEPNKSKIAATDAAQTRMYTIIGSLLTVLVVFLTRTR